MSKSEFVQGTVFNYIEEGWECQTCSYYNTTNSDECSMCCLPTARIATSGTSMTVKEAQYWSCSSCTYSNKHSINNCEMCNNPSPNIPPPKAAYTDTLIDNIDDMQLNHNYKFHIEDDINMVTDNINNLSVEEATKIKQKIPKKNKYLQQLAFERISRRSKK